jgi:DivIVA domain-containing protein
VTPEDVRSARFAAVRRGGYEIREVDGFLAEAVEALEAGDGRMSPEHVRDARFTLVKRGGYDTQEVDAFLDELMEELERRVASGAPTPQPVPAEPRAAAAAAAAAPGDRAPEPDASPAPAAPVAAPPAPRPAPAAPMAAPSDPGITSGQLRGLTPPRSDGPGYDVAQVDGFLEAVAETLEVFEGLSGPELRRVRGSQYLQGADGGPLLLAGDQVRAALFGLRPEGGYDVRGIDAAVRRLGMALDHHWHRD